MFDVAAKVAFDLGEDVETERGEGSHDKQNVAESDAKSDAPQHP
jgi:hypothetical protein